MPLLSSLQRDVQGSSGGATLSGRFHNAVFVEGTAAASPVPPDAAFIARSLHLLAALFVTQAWADGSPRDPPLVQREVGGEIASTATAIQPPPPDTSPPAATPPEGSVLPDSEGADVDAWPDALAVAPASTAAEGGARRHGLLAPLPPEVAAARRRVRATLIQELYLHVRAPSKKRLDANQDALTSVIPAS